MLDAKTRNETALAWADIKRLIKIKDANELRSALKKFSGVVPSKIYESVKDLWKDPKKSEAIDLLLSWGSCKKRLGLFRYLLMTNSANKSSELEDPDDGDDGGAGRSDGSGCCAAAPSVAGFERAVARVTA
ncbi:hypothetical protein MRS44_015318 [Fusarium solani]|uniref:uncharacterized protein n=1 Tax=Fusarium solani TaxID=169388 RepID=UPI0032C4867E|nr:hypothetical protein MRS44_015318 [Fusarium solani]